MQVTMVVATRSANNQTNNLLHKKVKKAQDRAVQQQAFNDLLLRKHLNGGSLKHGDMVKVINEYRDIGFTSVTQHN
jgi:hypothetical protein